MIAAMAGSNDDDETVRSRTLVGKLLIERCPDCIYIKDTDGMDAVCPCFLTPTY